MQQPFTPTAETVGCLCRLLTAATLSDRSGNDQAGNAQTEITASSWTERCFGQVTGAERLPIASKEHEILRCQLVGCVAIEKAFVSFEEASSVIAEHDFAAAGRSEFLTAQRSSEETFDKCVPER
ncbi:hypothetical protein J2T08_005771 [Neorhizobium galegae]|uniref:hypothetical protein n=1 Tax=Neorhizobium galegae TaxID=399 RepID=UPI0027820111|nr:hypothetical protein [Neorhizobium galegae]MDQ0137827.1 hypothetical protein [Neorhizobium galegae]